MPNSSVECRHHVTTIEPFEFELTGDTLCLHRTPHRNRSTLCHKRMISDSWGRCTCLGEISGLVAFRSQNHCWGTRRGSTCFVDHLHRCGSRTVAFPLFTTIGELGIVEAELIVGRALAAQQLASRRGGRPVFFVCRSASLLGGSASARSSSVLARLVYPHGRRCSWENAWRTYAPFCAARVLHGRCGTGRDETVCH